MQRMGKKKGRNRKPQKKVNFEQYNMLKVHNVRNGFTEMIAFNFVKLYYFSSTEESPAAKKLRSLIKEHLSEELKKLKISVDEQIKESEELLHKKLSDIEGSGGAAGRKSPGKGKRK